jgi:hypothetical protein
LRLQLALSRLTRCACCVRPQLFLDGPPTSAEEAHRVRARGYGCGHDGNMTRPFADSTRALVPQQGLVRSYGSLEAALAAAQRA